jgi:hypothetical protein
VFRHRLFCRRRTNMRFAPAVVKTNLRHIVALIWVLRQMLTFRPQ